MKTMSIKFFMLLMFITGILQMDFFDISWETLTTISVVHVFISILIALILLIPFANMHAYKYIVIKRVNSLNGWLLGSVLFLITMSGFYLFLVGNRGSDILGIYAFNIHLYGSFVLMALLFFHVRAKSFSNSSVAVGVLTLFLCVTTPSYSQPFKLSSLKLEDNKKSYHNEDWTNSAKCKNCHEDIFNQWANSNHKNLVDSNPYYMVMETIAAETEGEEFRQWCMSCHNPSGLTTGLSKTTHLMDENLLANTLFDKNGSTLLKTYKEKGNIRLEEGVSCVACHRISEAKKEGNASYSLDLTNRKKYPFEESETELGHFLSEKFINAKPQEHKKSYSNKLYKSSAYCASCHDETSPTTGKKIVATYDEWEASPFNNPEDKTKHKTCIDCHMTSLEDNKFKPQEGFSTTGGVKKKDVKVHYFSGSNHFLSGLKSKEHENQTIQLLKTAAALDVSMENGQLKVGVKNVGAGHHLPTGVADFRELWLDITVKDKEGSVVFSSGKLKKDGNLGKDARPFMKVFGDKDGNEVGLLFWRYEKLLSDTRIKAGERRVEVYNIGDTKSFSLEVTVKLNFRIYPQWVTSMVQKVYPVLPNPPVIELEKVIKVFNLRN